MQNSIKTRGNLFTELGPPVVRTEYSSHDIPDISSSQSSHLKFLSKRFSSRSCLKFRGGNGDRNHMDFIHLPRRLFLTPFCLFIICAARSQKIVHLTISMEPALLLEKLSSYGLLPWLWLLLMDITISKNCVPTLALHKMVNYSTKVTR